MKNYLSKCDVLFVHNINNTLTDSTATKHTEEVHPGMRGRDRENQTDAGAPQHQLLQAPPNIR